MYLWTGRNYCKHYFCANFTFPYVQNSLHFNSTDFPTVFFFTLHITKNIAYVITEVLILHADKLTLISNSKILHVFNFAILLKSPKFYACEIHV